MQLVSSLPPLQIALKNSAWITRGWTYQEAILSRRCLFFTELQVYFVCACLTCCEAVIRDSDGIENFESSRSTTTLSAEIFGLDRWRDVGSKTEFRQLADHITGYTARIPTYQDDAPDAFRGILTRSPFHSYYGIPIAPSDGSKVLETSKDFNIGFARGLYWFPRVPSTLLSRHSKFPSWSWTGWKGSV